MWKKEASIKNRLNMLLVICLVPLTVLILYLVVIMQQFSGRYDEVVENITKANAYNIDFKDDLDYQMYIIVANSERADELIDTEEPRRMIEEAREVFQGLYESADAEYGKQRLNRILKSLNILEDRVIEIETDAKVSGFYDKNMERLDLDIRVLTELIQEQIQEYIYYETTNLEMLREAVKATGRGLHIHAAEDLYDVSYSHHWYGKDLLARLAQFDLIDSKTLVAHGLYLSKDDITLLNQRDAFLVHNARSNMNNHVGYNHHLSDIRNLALGTDVIGSDMFEEMKFAFFKHRDAGGPLWPDSFAKALTNGNELMSRNFGAKFGLLEAGYKADLTICDYNTKY